MPRDAHRQPREPLATGSRPPARFVARGLYELYRRCSLAVLNSGGETDDARAIFERHADFDIRIARKAWGIKLDLRNAPASAFVDGRMIRGIQEHLFAVLRDILYIHGEVYEHGSVELDEAEGITNAVYRILRNAGLLRPRVRPDIVVCWVATRSAARSTTTPSASAMRSGCAASTSARAAGRAR